MADGHVPVPASETSRPTVVAIAPPRSRAGSCLGWTLGISLMVNMCAGIGLVVLCFGAIFFRGGATDGLPQEKYHSGKTGATRKVAIVEVDGVILEGFLAHAQGQIDAAARDREVRAVVLRIDSPGGSVTGSDDLHRRIVQLRDGTRPQASGPKPVLVSMGSMATSGGYYIAMPAGKGNVFAERTTTTGSIGVYAALPNVKELGDKIGFRMEVISRGEVKYSGSPFKTMTAQERAVWQDLIDDSYDHFLQIVAQGRGVAPEALRKPVIEEERTDREGKKFSYIRRLADGGSYTATQAKKFGLIDDICTLEEVVELAAAQADLGSDYQAIRYVRPTSLTDLVLGMQTPLGRDRSLAGLDLAAGLTPRLWYLAPQSELAGIAAALER